MISGASCELSGLSSLLNSYKVTFLSRNQSLLKRKKIPFEEIDIDLNYEKKVEMLDKSNGRTSVPQIFYKNHHIGGCEDLFKLEEENALDIFNN